MPTDAAAATSSRLERLQRAGAWLKGERTRRGWTHRHLASLADTTQAQISNYERGVAGICPAFFSRTCNYSSA